MRLREIISRAKPDKHFHWHGKGYCSTVFGFRINYETPTDLTAAIWEIWWDHPEGDTPTFDIKDVITAAGSLWENDLMTRISGEINAIIKQP